MPPSKKRKIGFAVFGAVYCCLIDYKFENVKTQICAILGGFKKFDFHITLFCVAVLGCAEICFKLSCWVDLVVVEGCMGFKITKEI